MKYAVGAAMAVVASLCAVPIKAEDSTRCITILVRDDRSKESIDHATVMDTLTRKGAFTDSAGSVRLCKKAPGAFVVRVGMVGYQPQVIAVDSLRDSLLVEMVGILNTVVVTSVREQFQETAISAVTIPMEVVKQVRFGGESDAVRAALMLPGVVSSSPVSSAMNIRGGTPDQNLILLDGMTVYNPAHLFGMISAFNSEAVQSVELQKGGYPAEYGGRMSAVMNVTQRDGNRDSVEGSVAIGLLSSRAALNGPLGNGSWFISGRRTYADLIMSLLPEDPKEPFPKFNFYDVNARVSQRYGDHIFTLSGILSRDALKLDEPDMLFDVGVGNSSTSLAWKYVANEQVSVLTVASASQYINRFNGRSEALGYGMSNSITDYSLKSTVDYRPNEFVQFKAGYEGTLYRFTYDQRLDGGRILVSNTPTKAPAHFHLFDSQHSAFVQGSMTPADGLTIVAGLRGSYWKEPAVAVLDPRLSLRYQATSGIVVKAAAGVYHQYLRLAPLPDFTFYDTWLPTDATAPVSRSEQYVLSTEISLPGSMQFSVDGYYKKLYNINEVNDLQTDVRTVSDIFHFGNGRSYGVELLLQKNIGDLTGWIGYSYSFVDYTFAAINDGQTYHPRYDRRHDFKIAAIYALAKQWDVASTFILQTGQGYTGATSQFKPTLGGLAASEGLVVPSQRWGQRLPPLHQLNVAFTYKTTAFSLPLNIVFDVYNAYGRKDILMRSYRVENARVVEDEVRILITVPTITAELRF